MAMGKLIVIFVLFRLLSLRSGSGSGRQTLLNATQNLKNSHNNQMKPIHVSRVGRRDAQLFASRLGLSIEALQRAWEIADTAQVGALDRVCFVVFFCMFLF